ncbi:LOW QUALITY PROTEIN: gastrotropin [Kogia breviceps]|uniref:LOW QUALITY PROTEIN: gastrotropin n=1 Tax=Kogia breviceps TaxID=27615 RepID=UPI002795F96C|nr:LOW QUALITY PROTEIN: gastrotropin [Kogia breviceps]
MSSAQGNGGGSASMQCRCCTAFSGKYETESEKDYDKFMKRLGLPSDRTEKGRNLKIISEVQQDGQNFTWTQNYSGGPSITNNFTIGKESNMETVTGKKFKTTVQMEGGKVVVNFPHYNYVAEIMDGKLVEISTVEGVSYERVSKTLA